MVRMDIIQCRIYKSYIFVMINTKNDAVRKVVGGENVKNGENAKYKASQRGVRTIYQH